MTEVAEWRAYFDEAAREYELAGDALMAQWISEHVLSERYYELRDRFYAAALRFAARLTAYNAFMDWRNR